MTNEDEAVIIHYISPYLNEGQIFDVMLKLRNIVENSQGIISTWRYPYKLYPPVARRLKQRLVPQNGDSSLTTGQAEREDRQNLVGFCDRDQEWYGFVDNPEDPASRACPNCGGRPSTQTGFQITTQRTFNPKAKKLTKAQLKRVGGGNQA